MTSHIRVVLLVFAGPSLWLAVTSNVAAQTDGLVDTTVTIAKELTQYNEKLFMDKEKLNKHRNEMIGLLQQVEASRELQPVRSATVRSSTSRRPRYVPMCVNRVVCNCGPCGGCHVVRRVIWVRVLPPKPKKKAATEPKTIRGRIREELRDLIGEMQGVDLDSAAGAQEYGGLNLRALGLVTLVQRLLEL